MDCILAAYFICTISARSAHNAALDFPIGVHNITNIPLILLVCKDFLITITYVHNKIQLREIIYLLP